ncbi:MAG: hypothetical protein LBI49_25415 [Nocardiopsaceae bacterium]|jgi:hypothetical protein|nr:hypothetical protein [Nocardiopsaceae bacterium]
MSDLLLPEQGARPWLPAGNVSPIETLNEYDIPLAGLIEQGGTNYLFACLLGEMEDANIWAYARVDAPEIAYLRSLVDDQLSAAIDEVLTNRMLIVAMAGDYELDDWMRIDAGIEGPVGLAGRFLDLMEQRIEERRREVQALERQKELTSR